MSRHSNADDAKKNRLAAEWLEARQRRNAPPSAPPQADEPRPGTLAHAMRGLEKLRGAPIRDLANPNAQEVDRVRAGFAADYPAISIEAREQPQGTVAFLHKRMLDAEASFIRTGDGRYSAAQIEDARRAYFEAFAAWGTAATERPGRGEPRDTTDWWEQRPPG